MIKVAGIRFRKAGKIYYFDPGELEINAGEHVIVETVRGIEYGTIVLAGKEVQDNEVVQPLKKVLRLATEEDKKIEVKNKEKEREAYNVCKSKIIKHELEMKLIDCEYTFDNNKLLFYFTSDGRVDFRELVKDLASVFKTRIELRQIGVRDETKMIGSIGICGRTLCCHGHLSEFHPVSIKMAKDQNLSLNPTKISGVCGRLMCCLKYEEDTYKELNKNLPRVGDKVRVIETGVIADVIKTNIIRQLVKIVVRKKDGDTEVVEMKLEDLELKRQGRFLSIRPVVEEAGKVEGSTGDSVSKEPAKTQVDRRQSRQQRSSKPRQSNNRNSSQKQQDNKEQGNARKSGKQQDKKSNTSSKQVKNKPNKPMKPAEKSGAGSEKKNDADKRSNNSNRNRNRRPRNRNNKPKTDNKQSPSKE